MPHIRATSWEKRGANKVCEATGQRPNARLRLDQRGLNREDGPAFRVSKEDSYKVRKKRSTTRPRKTRPRCKSFTDCMPGNRKNPLPLRKNTPKRYWGRGDKLHEKKNLKRTIQENNDPLQNPRKKCEGKRDFDPRYGEGEKSDPKKTLWGVFEGIKWFFRRREGILSLSDWGDVYHNERT